MPTTRDLRSSKVVIIEGEVGMENDLKVKIDSFLSSIKGKKVTNITSSSAGIRLYVFIFYR